MLYQGFYLEHIIGSNIKHDIIETWLAKAMVQFRLKLPHHQCPKSKPEGWKNTQSYLQSVMLLSVKCNEYDSSSSSEKGTQSRRNPIRRQNQRSYLPFFHTSQSCHYIHWISHYCTIRSCHQFLSKTIERHHG